MGSEERGGAGAVAAEAVLARAEQFSFFALVAYLERVTGKPVGGELAAVDEAIRFLHDPSMAFSPGDITQATAMDHQDEPGNPWSPKRRVYEVMTTFLGLVGSATPLPLYFAEEVAQGDPDHPARRQFLDLFHHRLVSLLYRAVSGYGIANHLSKTASDAWSRRILALAGFDTYQVPAPTRLPLATLLRLCALLATRARTARTLELMLADVLGDQLEGAEVRIRQFVGDWVEIEPSQRTRLAKVNTELGRNLVLGRQIYDRGGKFEVEIGPATRHLYERFLPEGDLMPVLREAVEIFGRDPLEFDVVLMLVKNAAPAVQLRSASFKGTRLGRDSWLGSRKFLETRVVMHPGAG